MTDTGGYFDEQSWYSAIEIDNKQGNISTQEADEIIRKLSFKSFESEYKIVVVWLAERMNTQAANKLLKICLLYTSGSSAESSLRPAHSISPKRIR